MWYQHYDSDAYGKAKQEWLASNVTDYWSDPRAATEDASRTRKLESSRLRGLDSLILLQAEVEALEERLQVPTRWTEDSAEWQRVDKTLMEVEYDRALDRLEGLVVARMFELAKMNTANTG